MLVETQSETFSLLSTRRPRCRRFEVGWRGETDATAVAEDLEGETTVGSLGGDLFRESFLAPGEVEESGPRCLERPRSPRPLSDASSRADDEEFAWTVVGVTALVEGAVIIWDAKFGIFRDLLTPVVDGTRWEDRLPGEEEVNANREKYAGRLARFRLLVDAEVFVTREAVPEGQEGGLARRVDPLSFGPSDNSSSAPEEGGVGGRRERKGALWGTPTDGRTGEDAPESDARARRGRGMVECQLVLDGLRA